MERVEKRGNPDPATDQGQHIPLVPVWSNQQPPQIHPQPASDSRTFQLEQQTHHQSSDRSAHPAHLDIVDGPDRPPYPFLHGDSTVAVTLTGAATPAASTGSASGSKASHLPPLSHLSSRSGGDTRMDALEDGTSMMIAELRNDSPPPMDAPPPQRGFSNIPPLSYSYRPEERRRHRRMYTESMNVDDGPEPGDDGMSPSVLNGEHLTSSVTIAAPLMEPSLAENLVSEDTLPPAHIQQGSGDLRSSLGLPRPRDVMLLRDPTLPPTEPALPTVAGALKRRAGTISDGDPPPDETLNPPSPSVHGAPRAKRRRHSQRPPPRTGRPTVSKGETSTGSAPAAQCLSCDPIFALPPNSQEVS